MPTSQKPLHIFSPREKFLRLKRPPEYVKVNIDADTDVDINPMPRPMVPCAFFSIQNFLKKGEKATESCFEDFQSNIGFAKSIQKDCNRMDIRSHLNLPTFEALQARRRLQHMTGCRNGSSGRTQTSPYVLLILYYSPSRYRKLCSLNITHP